MKAIILVSLFVAATYAATCVPLVQDDTACAGHRANFPSKVCTAIPGALNVSSAGNCDSSIFYGIWAGLCPLKNTGNASYCDGTGYATGYTTLAAPCFTFVSCANDDECNPTVEPVAPQAPPPLLCYECCTFCFEDSVCKDKVKNNQTFTDSTTCTPCRETETPAAPGTPGAKSPNTAAAVVVSGTILAFAATLLF